MVIEESTPLFALLQIHHALDAAMSTLRGNDSSNHHTLELHLVLLVDDVEIGTS
jgi:hypothetical protein